MVDNTGRHLIWFLGFVLIMPIVLLVLFGRPGTAELSLVRQLKLLEGAIEEGEDNATLIRFENINRQAKYPVYLDRISSTD